MKNLPTVEQLTKDNVLHFPILKNGKPDTMPTITQIDNNLWMGGVPDDGAPRFFKSILDVSGWNRYPMDPSTEYRKYELEDSWNMPSDAVIHELADWVNERRKRGPVLVHCAMGLNRSGLIAALALIKTDIDPARAIELIREKRHPFCLSNRFFEYWLMRQTP